MPEDNIYGPCPDAMLIESAPWLSTPDLSAVTCGNCKRTIAYKGALADLS